MVNQERYGSLTPEKASKIITGLRSREIVTKGQGKR
jgi:hypothetical protein